MLKKFVCMLLVIYVTVFSVSALKIDGILDESDWKKAKKYSVVTSPASANCDVKLGVVSVFSEHENNCINLGFKVKLSESIDESDLYGVAISVNNSDFIYIKPNSLSDYDTDLYGVDYSFDVTGEDTFNVEIALIMKYGIDKFDAVRVRFVDASGIPSTVFDLDYVILSTVFDEETATVPTIVSSTESNIVINKVEKTTKNKTTKLRTTRTTKVRSTKLKSNKEYISTASTAWYQNTTDENATTQLNMKQMRFYDGAFKALVSILLVLVLGICVYINTVRQNKMK